MTHKLFVAAIVTAAGLLTADCGGACVAKGDRITVDLVAGKDINDAGAGAQQAPFRIWAVSNLTLFKAQNTEILCRGDVAAIEAQKIGKAFVTSSGDWIVPGTSVTAGQEADNDGAFTHVAVAMMMPSPVLKIEPLDCSSRDGYSKEDKEHHLKFLAGKNGIRLGEGKDEKAK